MPQFWCGSGLILVQNQGLVDLLVMSETHPVCWILAVHRSHGCCQTWLDLADMYLLQTFFFCLLFEHSPVLLSYLLSWIKPSENLYRKRETLLFVQ